jgi:hypothetical protein
MAIPDQIKIYHILHVDRLPSMIKDGCLWCDAEVNRRSPPGTTIGMNKIKERRLKRLTLATRPDLHVGDCVPFYFCPRSVMLYIIHQANHPELEYRGGQEPIIHIEADFLASVVWAQQNNLHWAFSLSNAGSSFFEDRCNLASLNEINWDAVHANQWAAPLIKEGKQAEFLMEHHFPWQLVERIGVKTLGVYQRVANVLPAGGHRPKLEIKQEWYY